MNLNETETDEANKRAFVERLMKAGWKRIDAEVEYDNIQDDEEAGL